MARNCLSKPTPYIVSVPVVKQPCVYVLEIIRVAQAIRRGIMKGYNGRGVHGKLMLLSSRSALLLLHYSVP